MLTVVDDDPDMPRTFPRWCPRHPTDVAPDTRHQYLAVPGCTWLYQTLPDCQRLYLDVLSSALVCQDLPFHRLTHTLLTLTGVNTFVCTGSNAQKLYVARKGWVGWKSLSAPTVRAPLSSANKETRWWRGKGKLFFHSSSNNTTYCHRKLSIALDGEYHRFCRY